jgi:undecaprenyl-phosphate galactose phosphotransferase/putative colanic acid biosynthesis UDP-glucose lipid carrier transferase
MQIDYAIIEPISAITEGIIIILASLAGSLTYRCFLTEPTVNVTTHLGLGLLAGFFYILCAYNFRLNRIQELFRQRPYYRGILASWVFAILLLTLVVFVLKVSDSVSRGSVVLFSVFGGIGLLLWRLLINKWMRKAVETGAIHGRRAIVLGDVDELARFSREKLLARYGIDEVERLSLPRDRGCDKTLALVEKVIERARNRDKDLEEVILAMSWAPSTKLKLIRRRLRFLPLPVRLLPDRAVSAILANDTNNAALLIEIQRAPLSKAERLGKRILDLTVASIALIAFAPFIAIIAIAIKLESTGPAIFRQRRRGFNGKVFGMYKFRTMRVVEDGPSIALATRNDLRVTQMGRVLRWTSMDEIPQLLNVIKGDMSVVGPRPHALAIDDQYRQMVANYAFRHHVIPGMSGWAQVNGYRGETPSIHSIARRVELDLWYINNWSFALDIRILLQTFVEVIRARNAY